MSHTPQHIEDDIQRQTRFRLNKWQLITATITGLVLVAFAFSALSNSQQALREGKLLSKAKTPATAIIWTQRESLIYLTRYSEYLAGGVDHETVEQARQALDLRLQGVHGEGVPTSGAIDPVFLKALKSSDELLAMAPPGILPEKMRPEICMMATPIIDQLAQASRSLINSYQSAVDKQIHELSLARERAAEQDLALLLLFLALALILFIWIGFTSRNQLRGIRQKIRDEGAALAQAREDLEASQRSLATMQSLNEAKNEFIGTVNHELRTPLTSITGYIDLIRTRLQRGVSGEEIAPLVETLGRNADSLLDLVESMLSISRLESADFRSDFNKLDLYENLSSALFVLEPEINRSGIDIALTGEPEKFIIDGNYAQLSQVFINLISNAIKFSPAGSTISITFAHRTTTEGCRLVTVSIADQGIGIPPEDIERLFTRFFRAKNAVAEHKPGTGLGLAIVRKILFLHGGDVKVKSELNVGTEFTIEIPEGASNTDELIAERRIPVLERAITRITETPVEQFSDTAHEIGGAIGFYGWESAGEKILELSRGAASEASKAEAISILSSALTRAKDESLKSDTSNPINTGNESNTGKNLNREGEFDI